MAINPGRRGHGVRPAGVQVQAQAQQRAPLQRYEPLAVGGVLKEV